MKVPIIIAARSSRLIPRPLRSGVHGRRQSGRPRTGTPSDLGPTKYDQGDTPIRPSSDLRASLRTQDHDGHRTTPREEHHDAPHLLEIRGAAAGGARELAAGGSNPTQEPGKTAFKAEELEQLVAPIALYPDSLVAQEWGLPTARARHDEERRGACLPDHAGTSRAPRAAPGVHAAVRARADADHPACLPSQGAAGEVVQAHMGRGLQEDGAAGTPLPRPSTQRRPQFGARRRVTAVAMKLVGHKTESVYPALRDRGGERSARSGREAECTW